MNLFELYIVFLRGSLTAFSGLASLPVIQDSLVIHSHVLTAAQLNEAVMITRGVPGPVGLYFVSVGYFVAGIPGAITGWLATITPAFLIIPMTHFVGRKMKNPRVRSILDAVITASAGLLVASAIPLAKDALTNPVDIVIALVSFAFLLRTNIDTIWILLAAGVISTNVHALGVLQSLT